MARLSDKVIANGFDRIKYKLENNDLSFTVFECALIRMAMREFKSILFHSDEDYKAHFCKKFFIKLNEYQRKSIAEKRLEK